MRARLGIPILFHTHTTVQLPTATLLVRVRSYVQTDAALKLVIKVTYIVVLAGATGATATGATAVGGHSLSTGRVSHMDQVCTIMGLQRCEGQLNIAGPSKNVLHDPASTWQDILARLNHAKSCQVSCKIWQDYAR